MISQTNSEVIKSLYESGLESITRRMSHRITRPSLWTDDKARNIFWKLFKQSFMNLAVRAYTTSGNYPRRKKDVVEHYASDELKVALETLNTINEQPKENVVSAAKGLVGYIQ